jgi:hypothetical protein
MLNYLETATPAEIFEDVLGALMLFSIPFWFPYAVAILKAIF